MSHKRWLTFTGIALVAFGLLGLTGTVPATNEPLRWGLDLLAWPLDGFPSYESREIYFLTALTGGFLTGWGVTVLCLTHWLYSQAPEAVRKTAVIGLLSWFVVDSAGSVLSGNWPNAVWNILVLMILVGPMWLPLKEHQLETGVSV